MSKAPRFAIGQKFKTRGKFPRLCTVVDIWQTYNSAGELVRIRYVAEHVFLGETVRDIDILETTIAIGQVE